MTENIVRLRKEERTPPPDNRLWAIGDVAAFLHVGEATAYRVAADPSFPRSIRIHKSVRRWVPAEVKRWAERQRD